MASLDTQHMDMLLTRIMVIICYLKVKEKFNLGIFLDHMELWP